MHQVNNRSIGMRPPVEHEDNSTLPLLASQPAVDHNIPMHPCGTAGCSAFASCHAVSCRSLYRGGGQIIDMSPSVSALADVHAAGMGRSPLHVSEYMAVLEHVPLGAAKIAGRSLVLRHRTLRFGHIGTHKSDSTLFHFVVILIFTLQNSNSPWADSVHLLNRMREAGRRSTGKNQHRQQAFAL